jgi:hypothetical protein
MEELNVIAISPIRMEHGLYGHHSLWAGETILVF